MGSMRRCRRLQAPARRSRLGTRRPAGHQRELGRHQTLRRLAVAEDRAEIPAAQRSRMGICGARRHQDAVLVGPRRRLGPRAVRHLRQSDHQANRGHRLVPAQRLWALRHIGQCRRMGRGLLERQLPQCAEGRRRPGRQAIAACGCCAAAISSARQPEVRSASRFRYDVDVRYYANGFRIVRDLQ